MYHSCFQISFLDCKLSCSIRPVMLESLKVLNKKTQHILFALLVMLEICSAHFNFHLYLASYPLNCYGTCW